MSELLFSEIYRFFFIFLRLGTALMLMPGFSSSYVNSRFRLSIALITSVVLLPFLNDYIPQPATSMTENIRLFFLEIGYGCILGIIMQLLYFSINLCGNFAGQATGFANAQMFDPTTQNQSIITETFLSILAITVIFASDLHHTMLSAVIESYQVWPVGLNFPVEDAADFISQTLNKSFIIGFKLGSPFIAFMLIFYTGMGLLSRLMPQLNIFFLSLPLQIYLGLSLLLITSSVIVMWFCQYFEDELNRFIQ